MGSKSLLVTRSQHDNANNYLYYWAQIVIKESQDRGIETYDLSNDKARKQTFESYIKKHYPKIIFLNGHGSETLITGTDNEVLLECGNNEIITRDAVVYALSCGAALILGRKLVEMGTLAFIGYSGPYELLTDDSFSTMPTKDPVAALFLGPSNLVPIALLKGNTVDDSYNRARHAYIDMLKYALSSNASSNQRDAAQYLWADINIFVYYGSSSFKLD